MSDARRLFEKASTLVAKGKLKKAVSVYREAIDAAPDDPITHQRCAEVLRRLERHDDAVQHYFSAARLYQGDGDGTKARALYDIILEMEPNNATARRALASLPRAGATARQDWKAPVASGQAWSPGGTISLQDALRQADESRKVDPTAAFGRNQIEFQKGKRTGEFEVVHSGRPHGGARAPEPPRRSAEGWDPLPSEDGRRPSSMPPPQPPPAPTSAPPIQMDEVVFELDPPAPRAQPPRPSPPAPRRDPTPAPPSIPRPTPSAPPPGAPPPLVQMPAPPPRGAAERRDPTPIPPPAPSPDAPAYPVGTLRTSSSTGRDSSRADEPRAGIFAASDGTEYNLVSMAAPLGSEPRDTTEGSEEAFVVTDAPHPGHKPAPERPLRGVKIKAIRPEGARLGDSIEIDFDVGADPSGEVVPLATGDLVVVTDSEAPTSAGLPPPPGLGDEQALPESMPAGHAEREKVEAVESVPPLPLVDPLGALSNGAEAPIPLKKPAPPSEPEPRRADSLQVDLAYVEQMIEAEETETGGEPGQDEEYVDDPLAGLDWDD